MSSIVVSGDTSGSCTLVAPAVAGASVLTLPVATDTLVGKATTDTLTNKTLTSPAIASPVISGTPSGVGTLTSATAVTLAAQTFVDFTGIPSWAKRITVMFNNVSASATSNWLVQVGSGSVTATGYLGNASTGTSAANSTIGFILTAVTVAANTQQGIATIVNVTGNSWVCASVLANNTSTTTVCLGGGSVTLAGVLDRVRITTVNGTDTFDAGSINIMYE